MLLLNLIPSHGVNFWVCCASGNVLLSKFARCAKSNAEQYSVAFEDARMWQIEKHLGSCYQVYSTASAKCVQFCTELYGCPFPGAASPALPCPALPCISGCILVQEIATSLQLGGNAGGAQWADAPIIASASLLSNNMHRFLEAIWIHGVHWTWLVTVTSLLGIVHQVSGEIIEMLSLFSKFNFLLKDRVHVQIGLDT